MPSTGIEPVFQPRTKFCLLCPHGESNLDFSLRRAAFYPLNYGDIKGAGRDCILATEGDIRFAPSAKPREISRSPATTRYISRASKAVCSRPLNYEDSAMKS